MDFQAMFDTISTAARDTRKNYHLTLDGLGAIIEALEDKTIPVVVDYNKFVGVNSLDSYRGYYEDLALEPTSHPITAEQLYVKLKQAHGATFTGYKGGEFKMDGDTPLWVAEYGNTGRAAIDAKVVDGRLVIQTKEV